MCYIFYVKYFIEMQLILLDYKMERLTTLLAVGRITILILYFIYLFYKLYTELPYILHLNSFH